MKTAPITVTEVVLIGGVCVAAYFGWKVYQAATSVTLEHAIDTAATAVDRRGVSDSVLGKSQGWFADTVQKGQDAGASSFVTSFFTGLTK